MDHQFVSRIRLPLQGKRFAGASGTEQANTHQAQIVRVLDRINQLDDLLCSDRGPIDLSGFRHLCFLTWIIGNEFQLLCHSQDGPQVYKCMLNDRFRVFLSQTVEQELQLEQSNVFEWNLLEFLDQVFGDLELGFLAGCRPQSATSYGK